MESNVEDRKEWLKWRQTGIGSSDAPIIMGETKWRTPVELYMEKIADEPKEDDSNKWIKEKGNQVEARLRSLFEAVKCETFEPCRIMLAGTPLLASLDGRSVDKRRIVEFKLVGNGGKAAAKNPDLKKWDMAKAGKVPDDYYHQVQHQLLVSNADVLFYCCYLYDAEDKGFKNPMTLDRMCIVEVKADLAWQKDYIQKAAAFWDCVEKKITPGLSKDDFKELKSATKLVTKFLQLKKKYEVIDSQIEELKTEILTLAKADGHPNLICKGVKIQNIQKQGSVDYSKVPQLAGVNLDDYRKSGSNYWQIKT